MPAYCYKNESHETCSCQYLGGGLLGDTNRLGGEGVHVHFLEDMAFLSTFWILLALPKVRFPQKNQHFSKGWSLCGLVWGSCYPPEEPDILSSIWCFQILFSLEKSSIYDAKSQTVWVLPSRISKIQNWSMYDAKSQTVW